MSERDGEHRGGRWKGERGKLKSVAEKLRCWKGRGVERSLNQALCELYVTVREGKMNPVVSAVMFAYVPCRAESVHQ